MNLTRRQLLCAASTSGLLGVAGCTGGTSGPSPETTTARTAAVTQTPSETATQATGTGYQAWLPTPAALGLEEMYPVGGFRLSAIRRHKSHIRKPVYDLFKQGFSSAVEPTGVSFGSLSWMLVYENAWISQVTVSEQDVVKSLTNNNFQKESTNGAFTVYANSTSGRHVAVNGNTVVLDRQRKAAEETGGVNIAVNTKQGETPRLVEQRASAKELTDVLDDWTVLSIGLGGTGTAVVTGNSVLVEGQTSTITNVAVYESASDVPRSKLEDQKAQYAQKEGVIDVQEVRINGRVAVLTLTAKTKTFASRAMKTLVS
ncbi:MAG: hypothetical protein ABEJ94_10905 [Halorientalis sp.]